MFCIALRSMSRLRFGLDLSTSAGPSHGFGCKVTTYFRYGQRKGKVFSCKYHHRRQKRRWRKVPSRRDGMRSRRDVMASRRAVMASRRAVSFRNEKKLFLILANFFHKKSYQLIILSLLSLSHFHFHFFTFYFVGSWSLPYYYIW